MHVENAWARATPPGAQVAAVYATLRNTGVADRLLTVETSVGDKAELHRTSHDGAMAQMRAVKQLEVPARGQIVLEPSGLHLMLEGISDALREGEHFSLTFVFEKNGRIPVEVRVVAIDSLGAASHEHSHAEHHAP
jgi:copper(I)-binding protein